MSIKMIALDLDRTTLTNDMDIADETVNTLNEASKQGVEVVVATGRTFGALPEAVKKLEHLNYIITSNGAHITDAQENKLIYSNHLNPKGVEKVLPIIKKAVLEGKIGDYKVQKNISIEVFTGGEAYIEKSDYDQVKANGSTYRDVTYILTTRKTVTGIFQYIEDHKTEIENINVNLESLEERKIMEKPLRAIEEISVTSSYAHNWELGNKTTSKANAVKFLADKLGIDTREELLACGDNYNDLAMIKMAKVGVAVDNASEEIKKEADFVAPSNEQCGVAFAVKKYVLEH